MGKTSFFIEPVVKGVKALLKKKPKPSKENNFKGESNLDFVDRKAKEEFYEFHGKNYKGKPPIAIGKVVKNIGKGTAGASGAIIAKGQYDKYKRARNKDDKKNVEDKAKGGRIGKKFGGGVKKNSSRMNKLEELGRVDSEKAYSSKGKRNLKAEKTRIVKSLNSRGAAKRGHGAEIR